MVQLGVCDDTTTQKCIKNIGLLNKIITSHTF